MARITRLAGTVAIGLMVIGCTEVVSTHGYAPPQEEIDQIVAGQDTRGSVRRKIGRPELDGVFSDDAWYYVATKIGRKTWHEPRVIDRRVVAIRFNPDDTVASVKQYGLDDGRVVDLETRTTPTRGRELTALQQILGNIGKVTADQVVNETQ